MELYNMEIGMFHYLHTLVLNESRSKEGQDAKAGEAIQDELEGL